MRTSVSAGSFISPTARCRREHQPRPTPGSMVRHARTAIAVAGVTLLAACQDAPRRASGPPECSLTPSLAAAPARVPDTSPYDAIFAAAGVEFRVPAGLLRAIGYVET